jgi:hypothetical protein
MTTQLPTNQPDVSIETDPAKNKAADKVADILLNGPWDESDDSNYGVPQALVEEAGKAIANRYYFAINNNEGYGMSVCTTPIAFFEKDMGCDQDGPISHLMPPRCVNASEAEWEFWNSPVETPMDAAKAFQKAGFFWNRDFQDWIDKSLTKELSVLEAKAEKPTAPAASKKSKPASNPQPKRN